MTTIDFSPLFRNSVGFDRMANMLNSNLGSEQTSQGYPPYNIEVTEENHYAITLAVAGFSEDEIDIQSERGVLTIRGRKQADDGEKDRNYLYRGIANRSFERKFNLADHVEVTGASLQDGMLNVYLLKEVPEAMKPRKIAINGNVSEALEHKTTSAA
ncbi:MAG: Hsp20 family protein [Granulosicoccaceae bacterium]